MNLKNKKKTKQFITLVKKFKETNKSRIIFFLFYENFIVQKKTNGSNLFAVTRQNLGNIYHNIAEYCL